MERPGMRGGPTPETPLVVVPYDPDWPRAFDAVQHVLRKALAEIAVGVEHVGSTAVPVLAAKPIIDIDVVIPSRGALSAAAHRLSGLGYRHQGDLEVSGREAFTRDDATDVPRDGSGRIWPVHHLYVCASDSRELCRHLLFRDWLRGNPTAAAEYGKLKLGLAEKYRFDRDGYTNAKTEFIETALRDALDGRRREIPPPA